MENILISKEYFNELSLKYNELKKERELVLIQLEEAREKGDLSENADYDAAKKRLREIDAEINKNDNIIKNSTVFDPSNIEKSTVNLFAKVTLESLSNNTQVKYQLVSEAEADMSKKKISILSPLGKELLNQKIGAIISYKAPIGVLKFKILDINYE